MRNRHVSNDGIKYNLGQSPAGEFSIMELLHGFSCDGVRTPVAESLIESGDTSAIVMEKLDAVNLQHVLNGQVSMPEGFDFKKFSESVESFLNAMHEEKGVAHMDLYPRNIMIDIKTGKAYVIDFGRAETLKKISDELRQKRIDDDFDRYDEMYVELENYFKGKNIEKKSIPSTHEVHQFGIHTKFYLSKKLKQQAVKLSEEILEKNIIEPINILLGKSKDLFISMDKNLIIGPHHFHHNGFDFYIGYRK